VVNHSRQLEKQLYIYCPETDQSDCSMNPSCMLHPSQGELYLISYPIMVQTNDNKSVLNGHFNSQEL